MTSTETRLQTIVAEKLQIDPALVPLDRVLTDDLGLDSFDLITVVLEIEQAFPPVSLSDESAQQLKTLRELAAYIDSRLAAETGASAVPD
jgi:acyl carrier protein